MKRIVRYLGGTLEFGLCYKVLGPGNGCTDANWGSGQDRRSIGGLAFVLSGAAISGSSKKQSTVTLSSTQAEYMALTEAVKESIWLQAIFVDLGAKRQVEMVPHICVDNQGALALAKNPQFHARTKHMDIQYHYVREHVQNKQIALTYCPTRDMTADIFTKALPQPAFVKHRQFLGLVNYSVEVKQSVLDEDIDSNEEDSDASAGEGRSC